MTERAPNSTGRGKYSKVIRELREAIQTLEKQCDRALTERDDEISRLRAALETIALGANPVQAIQAIAALDNLGTEVHTLPAVAQQPLNREAVANAIINNMPRLNGLNAAVDAIMALALPSTTRATPIMRAAENAAKVVDGWSDTKKDYAERVTASSVTSTHQREGE